MEVIRSQQNAWVKQLLKLQTAKGRKKQARYLLEGEHLVEEVIRSQKSVECFVVSERASSYYQSMTAEYPTTIVSDALFEKLSTTQTQQGILAVVPLEKSSLETVFKGRYLLLDAVQDPGNLGTIIRSADAAGFDAVVVGEGCVDVFNDKVIRSMQGSQFHLPLYHEKLEDLIPRLKKQQIPVVATALHERAVDYQWLRQKESVAIIVGNEGQGVRKIVMEQADILVKIPLFGQAESLNVAVASALLMYQTRA